MSILKAELEENKVADWLADLIDHNCLIAELDYALRPTVHEGKIRPYGFIVLNDSQTALPNTIQVELSNARKIADGGHSFLLFKGNEFQGVLLLDQKVETEWQLVNLQQTTAGIICRTTTQGITQLFCQEGVLVHQLRRWFKKPTAQHMVHSIYECLPQINIKQLQHILEFCFYQLSPHNIGTTLVWYIAPICDEELDLLLPTTQLWRLSRKLEFKVGSAVNNAVLQHVLSYTDGATILDADGTILGAGVHLKYSRESARSLPPYKGTRHTSALRFSYDCPHAVMFVVSSDGSLTVFSGGKPIAMSDIYIAE